MPAIDAARNAVECDGRWHCWAEIAQWMRSVERVLLDADIDCASAVGVILPNCAEALATVLQVVASHRCMVPLNPFQPPERIAAEIEKLQLRAVIGPDQCWRETPILDAVKRAGALGVRWKDGNFDVALLAASPAQTFLPEVAVLMLTSGTTGPAKRVELRYEMLERSLMDAFAYESGDRGQGVVLRSGVVLLATPLVHIGGLWAALSAVAAGRCIAMLEKFAVEPWRAAVVRHRPKLVSLPPTAIRMVLDAAVPPEDLASLKAIRAGAAPLDPGLQEAFEARYGVPILNAYGATEFAGSVAGWTYSDHQTFGKLKRGSVGRAQPGVKLRVVDRDTGMEMGPARVGLLEVRSPQLGSETWVRTSDLAEIDDDGFLYIRGRADDAIIRGGFKILPGDVAKVLLEHPAIAEASVVGIPDARLGAVPVAAVEVRQGEPVPSEAELIAHVRSRMIAYQVPVQIKFVDRLPRTPSMKISQPDVRALFTLPA